MLSQTVRDSYTKTSKGHNDELAFDKHEEGQRKKGKTKIQTTSQPEKNKSKIQQTTRDRPKVTFSLRTITTDTPRATTLKPTPKQQNTKENRVEEVKSEQQNDRTLDTTRHNQSKEDRQSPTTQKSEIKQTPDAPNTQNDKLSQSEVGSFSMLNGTNITEKVIVTWKNRPIATFEEIESNKDVKKSIENYFFDFVIRTGDLKKRLPKAIVFGCSKCGSRAFLDFLDLHPDVVGAGSEKDFFNKHYEQGLPWYLSTMPDSYETQMTIEKSPDYFEHPDVPERIKRMNSTVKLIVIVCEPIKRAISDYVQDISYREAEDVRPFEFYMTLPDGTFNAPYYAIKRGEYSVYMERWLQFFPLKQIHVVDGKQLKVNPFKVMVDAEKYLGLRRFFYKELFPYDEDTGFFCYLKRGVDRKCLTRAKGRAHPKVDPKIITLLRNHFKPFNEKFFSMVKKRFNWVFVQ